MVQIIAPAGWLAAGDATAATVTPEVALESTATGSLFGPHALLWTTGAAAIIAASGVIGALAIGVGEEVAEVRSRSPVVQDADTRHKDEKPEPTPERTPEKKTDLSAPPVVVSEPAAPKLPDRAKAPAVKSSAAPTVAALPPLPSRPVSKPEAARTLTLEPVLEPSSEAPTPSESSAAAPDYPPAIEGVDDGLKATIHTENLTARVTNVTDRLSIPIESIDLPAMSIVEFVNLLSDMAAVPIVLDPKVLGDVGLSTRTQVTVEAKSVTVGSVLSRVLDDHGLACEEREGRLVVVKLRRN